MFEKEAFRKEISQTLIDINLHSTNAVELLMGTCAQESAFGKYNRQLGGGPALGVFQMEPATFQDIIKNYLHYKQPLFSRILDVCGLYVYDVNELVDNNRFAICMARVHYLRVKEALPGNLDGWAHYWKQHYNTPKGRGTVEEFIANYKKYCL